MSSIYHTEPPTQGKVVIKTSFGEIGMLTAALGMSPLFTAYHL